MLQNSTFTRKEARLFLSSSSPSAEDRIREGTHTVPTSKIVLIKDKNYRVGGGSNLWHSELNRSEANSLTNGAASLLLNWGCNIYNIFIKFKNIQSKFSIVHTSLEHTIHGTLPKFRNETQIKFTLYFYEHKSQFFDSTSKSRWDSCGVSYIPAVQLLGGQFSRML